jgi:hypothetical protein
MECAAAEIAVWPCVASRRVFQLRLERIPQMTQREVAERAGSAST